MKDLDSVLKMKEEFNELIKKYLGKDIEEISAMSIKDIEKLASDFVNELHKESEKENKRENKNNLGEVIIKITKDKNVPFINSQFKGRAGDITYALLESYARFLKESYVKSGVDRKETYKEIIEIINQYLKETLLEEE